MVRAKDIKNGGKKEFTAQRLLVAVGRKSNADRLKVENTGVEAEKEKILGFHIIGPYAPILI